MRFALLTTGTPSRKRIPGPTAPLRAGDAGPYFSFFTTSASPEEANVPPEVSKISTS
jgi:hypothetical protein